MVKINRRTILASAGMLAITPNHRSSAQPLASTIAFDFGSDKEGPRFEANDFNIAGIYDFDWLLAPEFERMLDLIASSPGAIGGIRSFGIFTMGEREDLKPGTGGIVWTDPSRAPDFTLPFAALEALTSRGLIPFISLGFFPPAVSDSPIAPPQSFGRWSELVRRFFEALIIDPRFGASAIASWWFEVWNEPNEGRFWTGSFEQYLELYRATAQVVSELSIDIRLGGPAMAYKPESEIEDGPETMARFLNFLREGPSIKCDFVSYHRKGTVDTSAPNPARLRDAALEIAAMIDSIVPERDADLTLVNNEADEKIGFESPYLPRMDSFAASWLTTLLTDHSTIRGNRDRRFVAVQDNANLQLMQEPFDGRRSIYSILSPSDRTNLVKTSGAVWYDLLPMLGGQIVPVSSSESLFPATDIHAISTIHDGGIAVLITWHPIEAQREEVREVRVDLSGIPWEQWNLIEWRIDSSNSNAYSTAMSLGKTEFDRADAVVLRARQELTAIKSDQRLNTGEGRAELREAMTPYFTSMFWITPLSEAPVTAPASVRKRAIGDGVEITWSPIGHPQLFGYELAKDGLTIVGPIRPTALIDSIASINHAYSVRAVSASGVVSDWVEAES